ncbi:DUF1345 domain-containing protein [Planosporangium mesophilum]|uniref:DUF1345 domain-containing protein n=1 Tax=Planosporangium mesophilum TaxID=689768 RepID=A0A8J3TE44_9ACTN|nr:DUF1345 domain-containing protein [Planosporangium mesophilum]NJC84283.1 DUF1345 domain-containing protein [Planosporangium mesophilum]GII23129.1 hypothetical protein Pme01_27260 [Planosporangium mesophilum]
MRRRRDENARHGVSARRRVATSGALGLGAGLVSIAVLPWQLAPLVAWDVAAVTFVCWVWATIWRLDARETARHAGREDPTRAAADVLLLAAAIASLIAIGYVIVAAGPGGGLREGLQVGFGVGSVLLSWSVIHTVFALRYARMYYVDSDGGVDSAVGVDSDGGVDPDGGVDFHEEAAPRYSDFAYLAFTIGMTFQVSDTELNTSVFRATVLKHALLSYLFGTVIMALTINLVAGLSR